MLSHPLSFKSRQSCFIQGLGTTQAHHLQSSSTPEKTLMACVNTLAHSWDVNTGKSSLTCNRGPNLANLALLLMKLSLQTAHLPCL